MGPTVTKKPLKKRKPKTSDNQRTGTSNKNTKIDLLVAMLTRSDGASIAEMCEATGWQKHSIRGAMAGAIRKKGFEVASRVSDGTRSYRIGGKQ